MKKYGDLEITILSCLLQKPELMEQITLEDNDIFYYNNDNINGGNTIYSRPNTVVEGYSGQDDINAYYPDLSTRKLVHEYVPVRYIEGGNDIPKEEEYGLYDLVDRIFIPINWGENNAATFIQAGGEINNE